MRKIRPITENDLLVVDDVSGQVLGIKHDSHAPESIFLLSNSDGSLDAASAGRLPLLTHANKNPRAAGSVCDYLTYK